MKKFTVFIIMMYFLSGCRTESDVKRRQTTAAAAIALGASADDPGEEYSAGNLTVFDDSSNAFNSPGSNLKGQRVIDFNTGNAVFDSTWIPAGNSVLSGRGPLWNSSSCRGCHVFDGRGRPPKQEETELTSMLIRLSIPGTDANGGPLGVPGYGTQLNTRYNAGKSLTSAEGSVSITYTEVPGSFPDGEKYSLRRPNYNITYNFNSVPSSLMISPRTAPMIPGLGLLEAIPESDILANADEKDSDENGISGRPNYVYDVLSGKKILGRFGWKANNPSLRQQNQGAFLGDMGITSPLFPSEGCESASTQYSACVSEGSGNNGHSEGTEINKLSVDFITFYTQTVGVPARRNWNSADVKNGKKLFSEIGCTYCHIPKFTTGKVKDFPEISGQTIRPYTDLLLHDMGEDLSDGRPDFLAEGKEWRTAPLWGIGLIQTVNGHNNLLHDGRARGFQEAVLWHGGEAEKSREKYKSLSKADRNSVLKFLESL
ncbi:MAG TPA: di-heme oxidoredictase family protein [Leptospiraceae bacterium]|nr:di-heme oxidoredictase family protein [Leptospiraceae bacterium]